MSHFDSAFADKARDRILRFLQGDDNNVGLYRSILLGIPDQGQYMRAVGIVYGLEKALEMMAETNKELNGVADDKPSRDMRVN